MADQDPIVDDFEEDFEQPEVGVTQQLILDIEGYEGPLDVLLTLARSQKVDLKQISILELVEQYLGFMTEARRLQLELAADYLVMAAWLAYLKSRLLLPDEHEEEEPTGAEMAARLAFQLQRLNAMRERSAQILSRHRLGRDVFPRGMPEGVRVIRHSQYECTLYELLKAYAVERARHEQSHMEIRRPPVYAIEDAMRRLSGLVGQTVEWAQLESFLPDEFLNPEGIRSAIASTFAASLEIARRGEIELKQMDTFGPIFIRRKEGS